MSGAPLLFAGAVLVAVGRHGGLLTGSSSDQLGWKQWLVLLSGIAVLAAGAAVVRLDRDVFLRTRGPPRAAVAVIGALGALLAWLLLVALDQSLWHDEAFTALTYIQPGPHEIVFGTYLPNDHELFNALAWLTTNIAGDSEVALRFWSVVPALAAAGALVAWAWSRLGPWVAVAVALLAATSPLLIVLSRQARGYGLAMLAAVLMLVFADRLARGVDRTGLLGLAAAGLVGTATLPVFGVAFVGQALPLMAVREARIRVATVVGAVGLGALLLYAPSLGDIIESTEQQFGRPLPWHGPFTALATDLLGPNVQIVSRAAQPPALPDATVAADNAIAGALALVGAILLWRSGKRMLDALVAVPILCTFAVLALAGYGVEPRFVSFLLLHSIVLAACGAVGLVGAAPRWARPVVIAGAVAAAGFGLVHAVQLGDDLHDLPHENFKQAAAVARAHGAATVLTDGTRPAGLQYYLGRTNVVTLPAAELERRFCSGGEGFVYIDQPYRPRPEEEPPPDVRCLRQRGAKLVRVHQLDRGGRLDVWAVPAR